MDNESLQHFVDDFAGHEELQADVRTAWPLLEPYTDEYNKTGNVSRETVDLVGDIILNIIKNTLLNIYSEAGIIKKIEISAGIGALKFLKNAKKDSHSAETDMVIDLSCKFIEFISSKYPIVDPILGSLFGKAAKIYFNAVKEESELIQGYEELIDYYLDEYYRNAYYQHYITALGNDERSDTTPADTVDNSVIITGTDGDDKLANSKDNAIINALGGDDTVGNFGNSVTIHGGYGDDSIDNSGKKVMIDAGAGNDKIQNSYSRVTINASSGDDSIYKVNGCSLGLIDGDDGNDYVYNEHEKVTINGGAGDDSVINRSYTVKVKGGDGNDSIVNYYSEVTLNGDAGDDYIENLGDYYEWVKRVTIDGGDDNDTITSTWDNSNVSINGGTGNDSIENRSNHVTIHGGDDDDYIKNCADITYKTQYVKLYGGSGNDSIISEYGSYNITINGGTGNDSIELASASKILIEYNLCDGDDTVSGFNGDDTLSISGGTYSTQLSGNDILVRVGTEAIRFLNANCYDFKIIGTYAPADTTPADTTLTVTNSTSSPVTINSTIEVVDASTRTKAVKITGNALDNTITGGSGNDTLDGNSGDDYLTGGTGADVFIYGAGNDTVTDYGTGNDKLSLSAAVESFGSVGNDFVFGFGDDSLTLTDAASKKISVVGSNNVFAANGIYNSAGTAVTLSASTKTFTADSKVISINAASTSGATIAGNSKANKVSLGTDNIFIWTGGNDTLMNFDNGDLISVTGAVTDGSISSGNSIVKVGTNKITVKDSSQVTFTDTNGTRIFDGGIFFDEDETSATLATSTKNFNASSSNVISITGNAKANSLTSNATGMTLTGGAGNDTFAHAGGDDFDTFTYSKGDGKDIIFNFGDGDLLEIVGLDGAVTGKFNSAGDELTVKVGSTSVAVLKDFGATTTFNVTSSGTAYKITK